MERLINRRQQGDLGEVSAIEWLTRHGAAVFAPLGHSPDVDLIALVEGHALRVEVKTSAFQERGRWTVAICTSGGNQSWTRIVKEFDRGRCDYVFALVADGRRWFIPTADILAKRALTLGGDRYSEYEIEPAEPIASLLYGPDRHPLTSSSARGSAGVRRAGPACKVGALALSEFESHLPHSPAPAPGPRAVTRVARNHQVTIPKPVFNGAELAPGDRLRVSTDRVGQVSLERIEPRNDEGPP